MSVDLRLTPTNYLFDLRHTYRQHITYLAYPTYFCTYSTAYFDQIDLAYYSTTYRVLILLILTYSHLFSLILTYFDQISKTEVC